MHRTALFFATALLSLVAPRNAIASEQQHNGYQPWQLPQTAQSGTVMAPSPPRRQIAFERTSTNVPRKVRHDVDGDGRSDLIWNVTYYKTYPPDAYYLATWRMDGPATSSVAVSGIPSGYPIRRTGDFNGDGRTDILLGPPRSYYGMPLWLGRSDGLFDFSSVSDAGLPPGSWNWEILALRANTDLNGDGRDDLILRDVAAGRGGYMLMDGTSILGVVSFDLSDEYTITGAGDFDGDGLGDLLCSDTAMGYLYYWRNRGDGGFDVSLIAVYDPIWTIVGNPDLNGDGRADIVWRNGGMTALWWLDGDTVLRADTKYMGPGIASAGDYDGDGFGDITLIQLPDIYMWRGRGDGEFEHYYLGEYAWWWRAIY